MLLIRSLEVGGAERQMVELAIGMLRRGHAVRVAVFYRRGPLADELERHGIEIIDLKKKGRWDVAHFFVQAMRALRRASPDVVYSYLGGANLVAVALKPFITATKIVWSVRSSDVDLSHYDWTHRLTFLAECRLSTWPDAIIANSNSGLGFAVAHGFPAHRIRVVPNGINTDRFRPDKALRNRQRRAWGLRENDIAVGILARLDPMKDHGSFLRAACLLARERSDLRFICVGRGPEEARLVALAAELGIEKCASFVGQTDPVAALNAFDVACSSSMTEGFPNAVAEAMACGTPCAVTDAGDSRLIVGDLGMVSEPRSPEGLARAILGTLETANRVRNAAARQRIVDHFSCSAMVEKTLAIFDQILPEALANRAPR